MGDASSHLGAFQTATENYIIKHHLLHLRIKVRARNILKLLSSSKANHFDNIPPIKNEMDKDSVFEQCMKTRTHSQAPARKRNRKGSWVGLKLRPLAIIYALSPTRLNAV